MMWCTLLHVAVNAEDGQFITVIFDTPEEAQL